jgi:hypothetical protein
MYSTVVQERKVEYYRGGWSIREEGGVLDGRVKCIDKDGVSEKRMEY